MNITERKKLFCGDCGVGDKQEHEFGCDLEICPYCGGQLNTCFCSYKYFYPETFDRDHETLGLPLEVFHNGLPLELLSTWKEVVKEKGRIPFEAEPFTDNVLCGKSLFFSKNLFNFLTEPINGFTSEDFCFEPDDGKRADERLKRYVTIYVRSNEDRTRMSYCLNRFDNGEYKIVLVLAPDLVKEQHLKKEGALLRQQKTTAVKERPALDEREMASRLKDRFLRLLRENLVDCSRADSLILDVIAEEAVLLVEEFNEDFDSTLQALQQKIDYLEKRFSRIEKRFV